MFVPWVLKLPQRLLLPRCSASWQVQLSPGPGDGSRAAEVVAEGDRAVGSRITGANAGIHIRTQSTSGDIRWWEIARGGCGRKPGRPGFLQGSSRFPSVF